MRAVAGVTVSVDVTQFADGTVERTLNVYVDDLPEGSGGVLDTDRARRLAGLLIEAADELGRLTHRCRAGKHPASNRQRRRVHHATAIKTHPRRVPTRARTRLMTDQHPARTSSG